MAPQVWLITGCSSGFGNAFARELLQRGEKVIATARDIQSIIELADAGARTVTLDVTAPVDKIRETVQKAFRIYGRIDVLLSNAGFVHTGGLEETKYVIPAVTSWKSITNLAFRKDGGRRECVSDECFRTFESRSGSPSGHAFSEIWDHCVRVINGCMDRFCNFRDVCCI
jgi:NAD(P)-dependent dehydrogenase (short-subunit alcohol dehydrogenase family)